MFLGVLSKGGRGGGGNNFQLLFEKWLDEPKNMYSCLKTLKLHNDLLPPCSSCQTTYKILLFTAVYIQ